MTERIALRDKSGDSQIDALLTALIEQFEAELPGGVSGYYVLGSYADGSGVGSSDLDVCLVLNEGGEEMRRRVQDLVQQWSEESIIELDIEVEERERLLRGASPDFKYGSKLVYGEDIRGEVELVPLEEWTRDRMHTSYWRTVFLFGRSIPVRLPIEYPDPQGEFLGYDRRMLKLKDGSEVPCTRDLIRLVGWSATGLLAWKAGVYVARKKDSHRLYKEWIGNEWGELLQDIYDKCRGRWNYRIPQEEGERQELREICVRTVGFENYFLEMYRDYLFQELASSNEQGRRQAWWVLKEVAFEDEALREEVGKRCQREEGEIRELAEEVWQRYKSLEERRL